jgi:hypothetical protein
VQPFSPRPASDRHHGDSRGPAIVESAPGHVDLVRHLFFGGLSKELLALMSEALEAKYDHIVQHGTLPAPVLS